VTWRRNRNEFEQQKQVLILRGTVVATMILLGGGFLRDCAASVESARLGPWRCFPAQCFATVDRIRVAFGQVLFAGDIFVGFHK